MLPRCEPGREARARRQLLVASLLAALILTVGLATGWAQEEPPAEEIVAEANAELRSEVVSRFEVVILSRGLLLEPLDEGVELRTIEVTDDGVALDGEPVSEEDLRDRLGAADAGLVMELSRLGRSERRSLFEAGQPAPSPTAAEEGRAEEEVTAKPEEPKKDRRKFRDSQVVVGDSLTVDEDEVADEAVVFGGPLYVYGKVAGDAAAIGGSVTVTGEVTGDVVAVGGDVTLEKGAEIFGDAVSVGGEVEIDEDSRVMGQIIEVPFGPELHFGAWPGAIFKSGHWWRQGKDLTFDLSPWSVATRFMWDIFGLVVLTLLACFVLLVARRPLERVQRRGSAEPWKSGLVGLLSQILFAPLVVLVILILVISIIGIPLLLLVPFFILGIILVAFLGYCGVALGVGRFLQRRFGWQQAANPYLILIVGVVAIQIWSTIGDLFDFGWGPLWFFAFMFGFFGVLIKYVAWTVGLGAAVLTRFGTAEGWGGDTRGTLLPAPSSGDEAAAAEPVAPPPPQDLPDLRFDEPSSFPGPEDEEEEPPK